MGRPVTYTPHFSTLILDLGDVLFSWSPTTTTSISPSTIRNILNSSPWFEFEKGWIFQTECYERVVRDLSLDVPVSQIEAAFQQARESLRSSTPLLSVIKSLKAKHGIKVLAMSNISEPDYIFLRTRLDYWSLFDDVFTSFSAGKRKPETAFFEHVIDTAGLDPRTTVFVDDNVENVLAAESVGMHGIVFQGHVSLSASLDRRLQNPFVRGRAFLTSQAGRMLSETDGGIPLMENFGQLLIWEVTNNRSLTNLASGIGREPGKVNFFQGLPIFTSEVFPYDIDTTSVAMTVGKIPAGDAVHRILDEMLAHRDDNGVLQVYFDKQRLRSDPIVCINALTAFHMYGRAKDVEKTMQWIHRILDDQTYLDGTLYYVTADAFFYFLGRLISHSEDARELLGDLYRRRVQELVGSPGDALALAMRILACATVGLRDDIDLNSLLLMQQDDGSWITGWIYKYGSSDVLIGNKGLTTAFALRAVKSLEELEIVDFVSI